MRIAIIGMGNLGEYLLPAYKMLVPEKELARCVVGIKKTTAGWKEKQERLPFPVVVGEVGRRLQEQKPDLLVFAPSPEAASELVKEDLAPYYQSKATKGEALPPLYSFVPNRSPGWFAEQIGLPVPAAKIMPSMAEPIGAVSAADLGATLYSLHGEWSDEMRRQLEDFLSPFGSSFLLEDGDVMRFLAVKITSHLMCDIAMTISDAAAEKGIRLSAQTVGGMIRTFYRNRKKLSRNDVAPFRQQENLPTGLSVFLEQLEKAWVAGMEDFFAEGSVGVSSKDCQTINSLSFEMNVLCVQLESREKLLRNTQMHATPGGLLEYGCRLYHELLECRLWKAAQEAACGTIDPSFFDIVEGISFLITLAVCRHGSRLKTPA